ncbi:MAG: YbaK/EbsC family protein [Thermoplasmata archaeon]
MYHDENFLSLVKQLGGEIMDIGSSVKTVKDAALKTKVPENQIIKSLLFITPYENILVVLCGDSKVSIEKLASVFGTARLATEKEVKEITGFETGAVPPIGIKIRTIMDMEVLEQQFVIGGGGAVNRLLKIEPLKIKECQNAEIMDIKIK